MFTHSTQIRVHYALTDQMGFVYHGHFAQFYEIGRTEALRSLGLTYKSMESEGVIMPVIDLHTRFLRPAKYDDLITVTTSLKEVPENSRITFHGEIFNEEGELLNKGTVTLLFLDAKSMKRCPLPDRIAELIQGYF
ncbi:MAG: acyl-CoA thioesterase [Bacteroidota bacterium]|nr:acyl-CoA thioesterase [Bacteroidota bacterium]